MSELPAGRREFSAPVTDGLRRALQSYVAPGDRTTSVDVPKAIAAIVAEAHAARLGPERVVALVGTDWAQVAAHARLGAIRTRAIREQLIKHCIALYFDE